MVFGFGIGWYFHPHAIDPLHYTYSPSGTKQSLVSQIYGTGEILFSIYYPAERRRVNLYKIKTMWSVFEKWRSEDEIDLFVPSDYEIIYENKDFKSIRVNIIKKGDNFYSEDSFQYPNSNKKN